MEKKLKISLIKKVVVQKLKEGKKNRVIGVLGGYGPYATHHFFQQILDNTPAKKDWEHLHVIIENNPRIPSRARAFLFNEENPLPYMLQSIERLEKAGADFFVCPCNSAHYFLRQIKDSHTYSPPFVDMVDITVEAIARGGVKTVGLIASEVTVLGKLYDEPLAKKGIKLLNISSLEAARLVIEAGKKNSGKQEARKVLERLIGELTDGGAEAIIYGCTELPLVIPPDQTGQKVYDTSLLLAKKCINLAQQNKQL